MKRTAVIMAGGTGERFWPLSRKHRPKQLLYLTNENKMMLEEAIERISSIIAPEDIFIITSVTLLEPIRRAIPVIPAENIVAEPLKRNTAPCLALAAAFIAERYSGMGFEPKDISISVLTADHSIHPKEAFAATVLSILEYVETNPVLATIGVIPNRPETGYGYIEIEKRIEKSVSETHIIPVMKFHEKPDYATALHFVKDGRHLWNSGMFFWRCDTFEASMLKCLPEVGNGISKMREKYKRQTAKTLDSYLESAFEIFEKFPNISIDYGLMEKADNVVVASASFEWDDIGSFDSLERIRTKDSAGNISQGNVILTDSSNSIIINSSDKMIVSLLGMEDVVVITTEDAVMICPKNRVQEVRKSVDSVRNKFEGKWL
ncbi:MAG: hypothetical protein HW421_46 [Ignavibacteria bacterium]|nr:hypothetical protein [Ignavibacteria bacterium]